MVSPASEGNTDISKPSAKMLIILGGRLALALGLALLGVRLLLVAVEIVVEWFTNGGWLDSYVWPMIPFGAVVGLVLLVGSIRGAKACVWRIKILRASTPGSRVVLGVAAGLVPVLLLIGITFAWAIGLL